MHVNTDIAEILEFKPFTPETKRSEALVRLGERTIRVIKGAPQVNPQLFPAVNRARIEETIKDLAVEGLKPLMIAISEDQNSNEVVGILGLSDRPREDSKQLIEVIKELGVRPKMITGDNIPIAKSVAGKIGIGNKAISLKELSRDRLLDRM